ncbi:hypothetical protein DR88_1540 [Klebsiella pneumoniae]|nr:hypothetical protein DR88_1540 [Klebsiella pneumoniae]KHF67802.1 hypothetical protein LV59_03533 [Klebsiella pneumoniae]GDK45450.1 hypothetical protein BvCmsKSP027_01476 [Escherichia coli]GDL57351.1 hypothetical protein BvCmsKSP003_04348 [Escherichia coli]
MRLNHHSFLTINTRHGITTARTAVIVDGASLDDGKDVIPLHLRVCSPFEQHHAQTTAVDRTARLRVKSMNQAILCLQPITVRFIAALLLHAKRDATR